MTVTLTINGQVYSRWTSVVVTRSLKRACAAFAFETPAELDPPILPFAPCVVADDGDPLITGYVDRVAPSIEARSSRCRIEGRSKTEDLVDCMPLLTTNQFSGSTLDAIARAMAAPFGIGVIVNANVGQPFPQSVFERSQTAFAFLERLARQRAVLLTDDENGNLVITGLGTASAPAALIMGPGGNIFRAEGALDGKDRFSEYRIRSQAGIDLGNGEAQPTVAGTANDQGVPRYRPWAGIAESPSLTDYAQLRAQWEAAHRLGRALTATLSVPEWRANGQLWQINTLVSCTAPRLGLGGTMLTGVVTFREDEHHGRSTELKVAPPSAFAPQPAIPASPNPYQALGVVPVGTGGATASAAGGGGPPNTP